MLLRYAYPQPVVYLRVLWGKQGCDRNIHSFFLSHEQASRTQIRLSHFCIALPIHPGTINLAGNPWAAGNSLTIHLKIAMSVCSSIAFSIGIPLEKASLGRHLVDLHHSFQYKLEHSILNQRLDKISRNRTPVQFTTSNSTALPR